MFLKAGKYHYVKGGFSELIEKDTLIDEMVDLGSFIAVKVKGYDYGSFAVFNPKKIISKPRIRNVVYRRKPCFCPNAGFSSTEWMAGVPIYCKSVFHGGACPLIKADGELYSCNYTKSRIADYIAMCKVNDIEVERIQMTL
jgi:hypothetical protein